MGILENELKALRLLPKSLVFRVYTVTTAGADTRLAFEVFLPMLFFMPFITKIVKKYGKKEASVAGTIASIIGGVIMMIFPMVDRNIALIVYMLGLVLYGLGYGIIKGKFSMPKFYITGGGITLAVWAILICAAFNNTAYFHSTADLQDSLTLYNSSSSEFTLKAMAIASLMVPFVVAYIAYCWKKLGNSVKKY